MRWLQVRGRQLRRTGRSPGLAGTAAGSGGPAAPKAGKGKPCRRADVRRRRPTNVAQHTGTGQSPSAVHVGESHTQ